MGKVSVGFTMSLDGFIAGVNDDVQLLFKWYFGGGDVEIPVPDSKMVFKVAPPSVPIIQELLGRFGAIVTGRRDFEVSNAWGGKSPMGVPIFIVTHTVPQEWNKPEYPFTFVTDGVESALAQAKKAAGDKDVAISGTTITRQLLKAGLIDEIHIDLAPVLLGDGIRLFDQLDTPIELESTRVIPSTLVTHLTYRVIK
ncbi:MAG TPA: dihydrofolate reductase family protein [Phototrophicaceae bacterium]|jgi:dihydrofolate reductase|nr:dihydrofolate reductase family protein [Phototrophicaceae bacterium]